MAKKNFTDPEVIEEIKDQQKVDEEPKKIQNEGKKLFSSANEGGTRLS